MFAVADAAVVQAVEAEGVHVGVLRQDFREHVDEEIAIGAEHTEHAAVAEFFMSICGMSVVSVAMRRQSGWFS